MITILSDDKKQNIGKKIYEQIRTEEGDVNFIPVDELDIKPCYSCGGCSTKTYGTCVIKDDMDRLLPRLIRTEKLIVVTSLSWGSYSSAIKKVLDRICVIGDNHYYMARGELVKRMRCNIKKMFAVGVKDNCSEEEKNAFKKFHYENIHIMSIWGKAFVIDNRSPVAPITEEIFR